MKPPFPVVSMKFDTTVMIVKKRKSQSIPFSSLQRQLILTLEMIQQGFFSSNIKCLQYMTETKGNY